MLKDKQILLKRKAYTEDYFKQLETIKSRIIENGLLKRDKLGNAVPVHFSAREIRSSQRSVSTLNDLSKSHIEEER